ncbi:MAG: ATP-binding protein [Bryobacteraceae bacterium]|nr:ATP-binding protein [Bryobacteraceae bacterium]MDW8379930.1 ATP-binding protein [Bryobacterales bacterium]
MSLRTRLLLLIVLLVTLIVTSLSAFHLNSMVQIWSSGAMERAELVAQQVRSLVQQRVLGESLKIHPPPISVEETKKVYHQIVTQDKELSDLIQKTVAYARMIVEIVIASDDGSILVSSNPFSHGARVREVPSLAGWAARSVTGRLVELIRGHQDYEIVVPLGLLESREPVLTIHVILSSVFLRDALLPQVRLLAVLSAVALLASILLAVFSANLALGPLTSISKEIDRIASGGAPAAPDNDPLSKTREFAIVQSKLSVLGQQIRGAQEDVTQMRSNIESLIERMEDAVLLFDRQDRLIMVGHAAERLLECPRTELLGRTREEIFPPQQPLGSIIQQAVRLGRPTRDHLVSLEREGKPPLRLLLNLDPLADRSGTLITLRDAETRRQLVSQLDVSRRLSAISQLTGGVAHEIKNPLNSIALRLELLRAKVSDENPEAEREINVISQEIRRLDRVVKTFLDFTRPVNLVVEDLDLAALASEVIHLVRPQATLQKVEIQFSAPENPVLIRGDRDLLKQAILNVVVNGIECMKNGGQLKVETCQFADHALLAVQDQGPGIPEALQSKVFQLYFTTKEKGSGIGLAMTFRAMQLHNGTIDFTSEAGHGTVFRLRFPLASQAA